MTPSVAVQYSLRPTISVRGEVRPVQRQPRCGLRHVFAWARALVMLGCLELGRSDRSGNGSEACLHAWARDNVTSKGRLVTKGPCRLACSIQLIDWVRSTLSVTAMHVCPSRFNPCAPALQIRLATQPIRSTACRTRLTNLTAPHCRPTLYIERIEQRPLRATFCGKRVNLLCRRGDSKESVRPLPVCALPESLAHSLSDSLTSSHHSSSSSDRVIDAFLSNSVIPSNAPREGRQRGSVRGASREKSQDPLALTLPPNLANPSTSSFVLATRRSTNI